MNWDELEGTDIMLWKKLGWPIVITLLILTAVLIYKQDKQRNENPNPSPTVSTTQR